MVIKTLTDMQNPFSDYCNIVYGERFIGREEAVAAIHNRVLGRSCGNISVVGLPRIGKTSLVWHALVDKQQALLDERKIIVQFFYMGKLADSTELYIAIMEKIATALKQSNEALYKSLEDVTNGFSNAKRLDDFFFLLNHNGYRPILILDEFDCCAEKFDIKDFQLLRELSTRPDTKFCMVTTSRNTLQEIEIKSGGISNFYGVFADLRLDLFDAERDLPLYWKRIEELGIEVSENYKSEVLYYAGRHPYLMDLLNYYVFNEIVAGTDNTNEEAIEKVSASIRHELWSQYDKILDLMKEEKLDKALVQIIVGPMLDVQKSQMEKLVKYGLLQASSDKEKPYTTFSDHFAEYLKQKELEFDIWPLWNLTENNLRCMVDDYLVNTFGEQWVGRFLKKNPQHSYKISEIKSFKAKCKKKFGNMATDKLVWYTETGQLWYTFISSDWNYFQKILGGEEKEWEDRFHLLFKVRFPMAHSNAGFNTTDDIERAKRICEIILEKTKER